MKWSPVIWFAMMAGLLLLTACQDAAEHPQIRETKVFDTERVKETGASAYQRVAKAGTSVSLESDLNAACSLSGSLARPFDRIDLVLVIVSRQETLTLPKKMSIEVVLDSPTLGKQAHSIDIPNKEVLVNDVTLEKQADMVRVTFWKIYGVDRSSSALHPLGHHKITVKIGVGDAPPVQFPEPLYLRVIPER